MLLFMPEAQLQSTVFFRSANDHKTGYALIVQRIERRFPKPLIWVRFPVRVHIFLLKHLQDPRVLQVFFVYVPCKASPMLHLSDHCPRKKGAYHHGRRPSSCARWHKYYFVKSNYFFM